MDEIEARSQGSLPLGLLDFPLVTMVAALFLYLLALFIGILIDGAIASGQPSGVILRSAIPALLAVATYKLVIVRLGACPHDDLGLRGFSSDLGFGLVSGLVLFSLIVGSAAIFGIYRMAGTGDVSAIPVALVTTAIVPAFTEEILFRGILFRWIEEWAGSWAAILATSVLFGLAHILNPGASWFSSFAIAVETGPLLAGVYLLTRNLWMAVGLHAAWNFAQGSIFGVPVSGGKVSGLVNARLVGPPLLTGGSFGLEASLFALAVGSLAGAGFLSLAVRRGALRGPQWFRKAAY